MIELRSDTFTLPTVEMLSAIAAAQLGDDGYREDPTVIKLEEFRYADATAIAVVMLLVSFAVLFLINRLQRWSADRTGPL